MRQLVLLTLSALAMPMLGFAQAGPPVRFGLKAGATLSTIAGPGTHGEPAVSPLVGG